MTSAPTAIFGLSTAFLATACPRETLSGGAPGCGIPCSTRQVCQNGACQCKSGLMRGDAIASKNTDGNIVTLMYNSGSSATYIVSVRGKKLQFSMPGNGWATVDCVR